MKAEAQQFPLPLPNPTASKVLLVQDDVIDETLAGLRRDHYHVASLEPMSPRCGSAWKLTVWPMPGSKVQEQG